MLKEQKSILSFWRDIEIFNLPDLPSKAKLFKYGSVLPWEIPVKEEKEIKWQHIVFFGKLSKEDVTTKIEGVIDYKAEEEDEFKEKVSGSTCMAAMLIEQNGQSAIDNGYIQPSYLYGLKCLQASLPLAHVDSFLKKSQDLFKERFAVDPDADTIQEMQSKVVNWSHLLKEIEILNELEIASLHANKDIYIWSFPISKYARPDTAFLNSFFLRDLNSLIADKDQLGAGLQKFIKPDTAVIERTDLFNDINAFWKTIDPNHIPDGRWPYNPVYGLHTAQLGAVNTCLSNLKNRNGLIGVNGPPGTGKTTLLSDIIADIIVTRAIKLMGGNLKTLFGKGEKIERENGFSTNFQVNAAVFDHVGIVVASNNNAAVENISKELPASEKVTQFFPEASYFAELTTDLITGDSWGVLAAPLGNSENKQAFKANFLSAGKNGRKGFKDMLALVYHKDDDKTEVYRDLFATVKEDLQLLLKELNQFKKEAAHLHLLLPAYLENLIKKAKEESNLLALTGNVATKTTEKDDLESQMQSITARISSLHESIKLHQLTKPSWFFFQQLFKTSSYKLWKETELLYFTELTAQTRQLLEVQPQFDAVNKAIKKINKQIKETEQSIENINISLHNYQTLKGKLQEKYNIHSENIPDDVSMENYTDDKDSFHKATPWSSEKINALRSRIFLLSLKLHEYAILGNAKPIWNNLNLFIDHLDSKVQLSAKQIENLWKTFFFCIPVVSTSLASVAKLFDGLGSETIGWLLIDEAGQATPQSTAGVINRAQRTIIIGDPLQIEPVVTINKKLVKMLRKEHDVELTWSPLRNSAQTLADRVSTEGTWLGVHEEDRIWTGFPLRAHRRCNNPMFKIANKIAYDDQMVKVQPDLDFSCELGSSKWFDIKGTTIEDKQVVMEEIALLREKITLIKNSVGNIFVISPFKSVAEKCAAAFRGMSWVKCGTIHTFQVKEADIVFLVLGSDPKMSGSREWASQKPNMLNVALTRAKKRFYVIGNKDLWKGLENYNVLAEELR